MSGEWSVSRLPFSIDVDDIDIGIDVYDNVLKNLRFISRYFELNGERNITASIVIDLQSMVEDNHVGFTRDELSYMLNNVCTT